MKPLFVWYENYNVMEQISVEVPKVKNEVKYIPNTFNFVGSRINPDWIKGVKTMPLRSCLLRDKLQNLSSEVSNHIYIKTLPKWEYTMCGITEDAELVNIASNELKRANFNKIKAMKRFAQKYQPLFQKRKVSLLFHTFTQANNSRIDFKQMLKLVKYHYASIDREVLGYVWTLEVSYDKNPKGHLHYHLCVAIKYLNLKGMKLSKHMKFEEQWGRRTGVEFVKKNVLTYMSKYFAKNNAKVIGWRGYGISNNLK